MDFAALLSELGRSGNWSTALHAGCTSGGRDYGPCLSHTSLVLQRAYDASDERTKPVDPWINIALYVMVGLFVCAVIALSFGNWYERRRRAARQPAFVPMIPM